MCDNSIMKDIPIDATLRVQWNMESTKAKVC